MANEILAQWSQGTLRRFPELILVIFLLTGCSNNDSASSGLTLGTFFIWAAIAFLIFLAALGSQRNSRPRHDFSDFLTQSGDNMRSEIQQFERGWVNSFSKLKGFGYVENDQGDIYLVNSTSFLEGDNRSLSSGERVLFQVEWTSRGPKAKNIIRVEMQSSDMASYSRQLIRLADRVKRLRSGFKYYKVMYIRKELNTCNAFFEVFDAAVKRHNVQLRDYEIVLLTEVEKDLQEFSQELDSMSQDSRWWVQILNLVLQILNIVADIIQIASAQTAELLRAIGRGARRLLPERKLPLLSRGEDDRVKEQTSGGTTSQKS